MKSIILMASIMAFLATAHTDGNPSGLQTYCGKNLARKLALLCYFSELKNNERSDDTDVMYNGILPPSYYAEQDRPWLPAHKARALSLPSRGKQYGGVAIECCIKACSMEELLSYC